MDLHLGSTMSPMTKDEMFRAISAQRVRLIDQLEGFTAEDWDTPSLCAGWKVRDVVGHLVPKPKHTKDASHMNDFHRSFGFVRVGLRQHPNVQSAIKLASSCGDEIQLSKSNRADEICLPGVVNG